MSFGSKPIQRSRFEGKHFDLSAVTTGQQTIAMDS